jgi:hypothetical protein
MNNAIKSTSMLNHLTIQLINQNYFD